MTNFFFFWKVSTSALWSFSWGTINILCNDCMENIELSLCVITTFQISYVGDYHLYMTNFCLSSLQYPIA